MIIWYDEAGRGPLAGPVYVGLVAKPGLQWSQKKVKDSKQLSERQREAIYKKIQTDMCVCWATSSSSNTNIDRQGIVGAIRQAICKAMWKIVRDEVKGTTAGLTGQARDGRDAIHRVGQDERYALSKLQEYIASYQQKIGPITLVLDGNTDFGIGMLLGITTETIIKGDENVEEIAYASICAKVERDIYMKKQDKNYPHYMFAQHKGYGTLQHRQSILTYGLCPLHRKSFCRNFL